MKPDKKHAAIILIKQFWTKFVYLVEWQWAKRLWNLLHSNFVYICLQDEMKYSRTSKYAYLMIILDNYLPLSMKKQQKTNKENKKKQKKTYIVITWKNRLYINILVTCKNRLEAILPSDYNVCFLWRIMQDLSSDTTFSCSLRNTHINGYYQTLPYVNDRFL